jgi:hypothetical protein
LAVGVGLVLRERGHNTKAIKPSKTRMSKMVMGFLMMRVVMPNGAPQAPRATGFLHGTKMSSRGCLQVLVRCPAGLKAQPKRANAGNAERCKTDGHPAKRLRCK